ncbi:DUF3219 family protein [Lederbergia lenta]|uniref:DUF3219 family protein n=1 Tax=Lederbergia lenta TaxID=1467 RepID=UPI0020404006|nr:DUF3219 family protein [Lederbergia lenta]MCM3109392.1 YkvR family protein [Lederbergia lenta]
MLSELILNDTTIKVSKCIEEKVNNLYKVSVEFDVTSEQYHDITTLLYEGIFDVKIPDNDVAFKGKIYHYSTSITNLYEKDQIAIFTLSLIEVNN